MLSERCRLVTFFSITAILLSYLIFTQGVNDHFYFDDHINLNALEKVQGESAGWVISNYILGNSSGPLGRPVSMAAFLIDDNSWPSQAGDFKRTNIKIHLVIGLLVFWLSFLILEAKGSRHSAVFAAFASLFWLFNPLHISTLYYPVQRMAQLATLFSVLSLIFYVKARLADSVHHTFKSVSWLIGAGLSGLAALFSKENAAVLPLLLLVLDRFLVRQGGLPWSNAVIKRAVITGLIASSLFVLAYIIFSSVSAGFFEQYSRRDFSPFERLLTQPQVILYYLKELYLPSLYTPGIYYDHWEPIRSILDSAPYIIALLAIIYVSVWLYLRGWYSGLALLFYFFAHIIESTALNLELVFEHRNYLPSIFLGLVFVDIARILKAGRFYRGLALGFPVAMMAVVALARGGLWSDRVEHSLYLASANPGSVRSNVELNNALVSRGMLWEASSYLQGALEANPDSLYLRLHEVLLDCQMGKEKSPGVEVLLAIAGETPFDGRQVLGYRKLMEYVYTKRCQILAPDFADRLLRAHLQDSLVAQTDNRSLETLYSLAGRFYALYPEYTKQPVNIDRAVSEDPEYLMSIAASLATDGKYVEALRLSAEAKEIVIRRGLDTPESRRLMRNIDAFRDTVRSDIDLSRAE